MGVIYEEFPFGTLADGTEVTACRVSEPGGLTLTVLSRGATVQSLLVPDRDGVLRDVALGYDTAGEYERRDGYLGATVGRVANRIGGAAFTLNGERYELTKNEGGNQLHGGAKGFDRRVWALEREKGGVCLRLVSPDGEEGYPGTLRAAVHFCLEGGALRIAYEAETDRDTPVNLTNHTYFNLKGGGSAQDHIVCVNAERFTEAGPGLIPTGRLLPAEGTPYDLREARRLSETALGDGYDINYCLSSREAAELRCEESGIRLRVETDMPGMQLYTARHLSPRAGKGGAPMGPGSAVCLETQYYPDAVNHENFPSCVLRRGEKGRWETAFRFDTF